MRIVVFTLLGFTLLGGLLPAGDSLAQDASTNTNTDAGRKVAGICRTCHGLDGKSRIPIAPHIGGEPIEYIKSQLHAFRDGRRVHEMMTVVASSLTDQQISDVAAWYNHFEITAVLPTGKTEDDAPELCIACHGTTGLSEIPDAPNLAGETNIYIETQLKAFQTGKRHHDIMTPIASGLTESEMHAASDWYSAISIKISDPTPSK
ncbi:c-type cytochrome [Thalassospira alkalitolerans]|uniref:c-type cytochrome n=1 Tax=Thalassospira alkalitolerans TaxID=1293890 RepID=UPI0030EE1DB6|tara:strand:+ start:99698 stop:100312 length:615 start_codon:yes stop_codon:yes gene_type:complete